jgi:hypothetical protein
MYALIGIIVFIILVIIWVCNKNLTKVPTSDNRQYNVLSEYKNRKEAAELLARINSSIIEFMRFLKQKYHIDETEDQIDAHNEMHQHITGNSKRDAYLIINALLDNYNPETMYENCPKNMQGETSYTVNKGEKMYVCLRNKTNPNKLVDYDILMFVMLHEMSHIANYNGWGHNDRFWTVFKFILHEATLFGIYTPKNYDLYPEDYCGLLVTYQPLYDESLAKLWEI